DERRERAVELPAARVHRGESLRREQERGEPAVVQRRFKIIDPAAEGRARPEQVAGKEAQDGRDDLLRAGELEDGLSGQAPEEGHGPGGARALDDLEQ